MQTHKTYIKEFASIALLLLLLSSCDSKPALNKKGIQGGEENVGIAWLKAMYSGAPVMIDKEVCIEGRIASSDVSGNFYKTLFVEDETGGISIRVDLDPYYPYYSQGRIVRLSCNSLVLSSYGGTLQLGVYVSGDESYQPVPITAGQLETILTVDRSEEEDFSVRTLTIDGLGPRDIGCLVRFDNVQFVDEELGRAWCDEGVDTDRHIVDAYGNRLVVRTSRFATFASYLLPMGSGSIEGVLTYFGGSYQLVLCNAYSCIMERERF